MTSTHLAVLTVIVALAAMAVLRPEWMASGWTIVLVTVVLPGYLISGWVRRRQAYRVFARAHEMRFVTVMPSDKRHPYTWFDDVRRAVLLFNVIDGEWHGADVRVFEMGSPPRGRTRWTAIIVLSPGRAQAPAVGATTDLRLTFEGGALLATPQRILSTDELPRYLDAAVAASASHARPG